MASWEVSGIHSLSCWRGGNHATLARRRVICRRDLVLPSRGVHSGYTMATCWPADGEPRVEQRAGACRQRRGLYYLSKGVIPLYPLTADAPQVTICCIL